MIHTLQVTLIAITCLTIDCVRSEHHLLSLVGIYASTYERVQMWVENSVISWGIPILFSTWLNLRTLFAGPTEPTVQLCSLLAASILLLCFCTIFLWIVNTNSLDCKEGHMKKNSLCVCVCLHRGQKNISHKNMRKLILDGFRSRWWLNLIPFGYWCTSWVRQHRF